MQENRYLASIFYVFLQVVGAVGLEPDNPPVMSRALTPLSYTPVRSLAKMGKLRYCAYDVASFLRAFYCDAQHNSYAWRSTPRSYPFL